METDITCPHCSSLELVQSVPALHADGVSTSYSSSTYTGAGVTTHGLVPMIGTSDTEHSHTSALVRALPMGPSEQPIGRLIRWGLVLLIPGLLWFAPATAGGFSSGEDLLSSLLFVVCFLGILTLPAGILFILAALRAHDNAKIRRGRPAAWAVWSSAWYCHRCGLAYWPISPSPAVPARQGFAPPQFQWFVWNAGRYARA
ncbi:hypothetical protein ACWCPQ_25040 [Nocardia sp. NPDC001965]